MPLGRSDCLLDAPHEGPESRHADDLSLWPRTVATRDSQHAVDSRIPPPRTGVLQRQALRPTPADHARSRQEPERPCCVGMRPVGAARLESHPQVAASAAAPLPSRNLGEWQTGRRVMKEPVGPAGKIWSWSTRKQFSRAVLTIFLSGSSPSPHLESTSKCPSAGVRALQGHDTSGGDLAGSVARVRVVGAHGTAWVGFALAGCGPCAAGADQYLRPTRHASLCK